MVVGKFDEYTIIEYYWYNLISVYRIVLKNYKTYSHKMNLKKMFHYA